MTNFKFHGGVKIKNDHKLSNATIQTIKDPDIFIIPLKQNIGATPKAIVKVGDKVKKYQLLAKEELDFNKLSDNIHSPTSGKILKIAPHPVINKNNTNELCVFLEADDKDSPIKLTNCKSDKESIINRIKSAGIVGMGGAGFPSYAKLSNNKDYLIINAAECEPYIGCDDALMQNEADGIIKGIKIMQNLLSPKHTLVGIEDNKPEAFEALKNATDDTIKIIKIPTLYPSGGEKQLIKILTNQNFAKNEIAKNTVCYNVSTIFSIYQAVENNIPLITRIITMTGNACAKKGNYQIKIGTPLSHILRETDSKNHTKIISGGPMMGHVFDEKNQGTSKINNCFIIVDNSEITVKNPVVDCIRCGQCAEVCPMYLLPQQLFWHQDNLEKSQQYDVENCIECACCDFVCPSNIPLATIFNTIKNTLKITEAKKQKSEHAKMRYDERLARLERLEVIKKAKFAEQRAKMKAKIAEKKAQAGITKSDGKTILSDKEKLIQDALNRVKKPSDNLTKPLSEPSK